MPTLPNMSLITPTLGGDSGTWDDKINAAFALVDAHDHTSGKGVLVPVSGLNINADFVMAGYAVTQLGSLAFNAVTPLVAGARRLFVSSSDNELYWRTNGGSNVKLTNGTSINTTLVGGIVGDYSSVGAELAYVDADEVYTFKQEDTTWARIASGPVRIYEHASNASSYIELASPAALAASYTVTFPAALPGSTSILQLSAAGVLSYYSAPSKTKSINPAIWRAGGLGGWTYTHAGAGVTGPFYWELLALSSFLDTPIIPIELAVGAVVSAISFRVRKNSSSDTNLIFVLRKVSESDGTETTTNLVATNANAPGTDTTLTASAGVPLTIEAGYYYTVTVTSSTSGPDPTASDRVYSAKVTYTE